MEKFPYVLLGILVLVSIIGAYFFDDPLYQYQIPSNIKKEGAIVFTAQKRGKEEYSLLSQSFNSNESRVLMELKPKTPEMKFVQGLVPGIDASKFGAYPYSSVMAISPDQRFVMIYTKVYSIVKGNDAANNDEPTDIDLKYFYLFDRVTEKYLYLGHLCEKQYKDSNLENPYGQRTGAYFMPIFWGNSKLFIVKTIVTKEGTFDYKNTKAMTKTETDATCLSVDLNSFTVDETEAIKVLSPWIFWADPRLGVVVWKHSNCFEGKPNLDLKQPADLSFDGNLFISRLGEKKVWDLKSIIEKNFGKIPPYQSNNISILKITKSKESLCLIIRYIFINGKKQIMSEFNLDLDTGEVLLIKEINPYDEKTREEGIAFPVAMSGLGDLSNDYAVSYAFRKEIGERYWISKTHDKNLELITPLDRKGYYESIDFKVFVTEAQLE